MAVPASGCASPTQRGPKNSPIILSGPLVPPFGHTCVLTAPLAFTVTSFFLLFLALARFSLPRLFLRDPPPNSVRQTKTHIAITASHFLSRVAEVQL